MQLKKSDSEPFNRRHVVWRVTLVYGIFGIAWILFSDWLVRLISLDIDMLHNLQNIKGSLYVLLSAVLIYLLTRHENRNTQQAARELLAERERLSGILEVTRVGTWEWNVPDGSMFFNERWAEMLGYQLQELQPATFKTWESLTHPDDLAVAEAALARHFSGEMEYYDVEIRMQHKDGHWLWIHDRGRLVERTDDGEPLRMLGTHADISHRKHNEAEIEQANRLYLTLSETNQAIVRFPEPERLFQEVCHIAVEYGGFRLAWIGTPDSDGWLQVTAASGQTDYLQNIKVSVNANHPQGDGPSGRAYRDARQQINNNYQFSPSVKSWLKQAEAAGFGSSAAFPLICDGEVFGVLNIYADTVDFFKQREIRLLNEMAADIGYGVKIERQRRQQLRSEARYHAIADGVSDAIVLAGPDRIIEWINPAFTQMFGYQMQDLLGRETRVLYADEKDYQRQGEQHYHKQTGPQSDTYEMNYRKKDGEIFVGETLGTPLKTEAGELLGYAAVIRDVTRRRHTEDQLRIAAAAFEVDNGIMITDVSLQIEKVNRAFTRITGYSSDEAVGRKPDLLQSGRHSKRFYQQMWQSIKAQGYWQGEIWNRKKTGEVYPEWLTISVVCNEAGELTHYIAAFTDISERKAAEKRIHMLAFYDPLTQLANRRLFYDRVEHARVTSERSQECGAILMLDLDHFKLLNDSQGHQAGDQLLIEVGRRIEQHVRDADTVSRLGGDEFVVLLESLSSNKDQAASCVNEVAEKIYESLVQPYDLADVKDYRITPSIGVTLFQGQDARVEDLLKQADVALYEAKSAGRNTIRFFNPDMQDKVDLRASMEASLGRALMQDEFQLYYQPQISAQGYLIGAEVLLRWFTNEGEMVSPAEFIPLSEDTGLIVPIGYWVIEIACKQLHKWQQQLPARELSLSINVSARQFHQHDFVSRFKEIIEKCGASPQGLKLELTESVVLNDVGSVIEKIEELKRLGLGFSMDDFGTGYSSLSYLKRLPLDQLKIDTSFVRDLVSSENDLAIVRAIIAMGHSLNLHVIAEGVETEAQKKQLEYYECDAYQGYLYARPMNLQDFEAEFINSERWHQ